MKTVDKILLVTCAGAGESQHLTNILPVVRSVNNTILGKN